MATATQPAIWQTTIWRFESNGYPRDRLFAISFTDPQARDDNTAAQPNRSSTDDELRELTDVHRRSRFSDRARRRSPSSRCRAAATRRAIIAAGSPGKVSAVALGGTPNHGVFATDWACSAANTTAEARLPEEAQCGRQRSHARRSVPDIAQRRLRPLRAAGRPPRRPCPDMPTQRDRRRSRAERRDQPRHSAQVDHRETACSPRAFAEIYSFVTGRAPTRIAITPEAEVVLNGRVTGVADGTPTNRPVEGAKVDIYRVSADTGERQGDARASNERPAPTASGGRARFDSTTAARIRRRGAGRADHSHLSLAFPRSFAISTFGRRRLAKEDADAAAIVRMDRPRGYFGLPRDVVLLDGRQPDRHSDRAFPAAWHTTAETRLD